MALNISFVAWQLLTFMNSSSRQRT